MERVHRVPAPPSDSAGAFLAATRWGGFLFVLHEAACFWSADEGGAWTRRDFAHDGPKGRTPELAGAWFARSDRALFLASPGTAASWRFEAAAGAWAPLEAGAACVASAGTGDRLYALAPDVRLRLTRNSGVTWEELPLPDGIRHGSFFDALSAEGDHLALGRKEPGAQPPAYSFDGGATWASLAPRTLPLLAQGRLYAFRDSSLVIHRPGAESLPVPAPRARAAFADSAGALFAWADSGLYALEAGASWRRVAGAAALGGWRLGRDLLYRLEGGTLAWFDGLPEPADGVRLAPMPSRRRAGSDPWPGGPAFPWPERADSRWDPLGRFSGAAGAR
jgi:hypothetical protein